MNHEAQREARGDIQKLLTRGFCCNVKICFAGSNVGSKVKADFFRLIDCRDKTRDSCKREHRENAIERMTKSNVNMRLMLSAGQGQVK